MDLEALWPFQLTRGHSKHPSKGACLLDAVSWFQDGCLNDRPRCVSPVLARLGHFANDILSDSRRQELRRFIPRLVGTVDDKADRLRGSYVLFICEAFAKRWNDAPMDYYSLENRFSFWIGPVAAVRDEWLEPLHRTELLTQRLGQAAYHVNGVHHWIDPVSISFMSGSGSVSDTVQVNHLTTREDVEQISIHLLDVCCAIGQPGIEWDFSPIPIAVERFQKARETV